MAIVAVEASRIHASTIRIAMRGGHLQGAENQIARLKHSFPMFSPPGITNQSHLRLPVHTFIHGILRNRQPLHYALREVGWMLTLGCKIKERTLKELFSAAQQQMRVKEVKVDESQEQTKLSDALSYQPGAERDFCLELRRNKTTNQHLVTALEVLRIIRMNGNTGGNKVTAEMYEYVVEACLAEGECVAAALAFEMMISDWAGSLSSASSPAVTTVSESVSGIITDESLQPDREPLTPAQFSDTTHGIFYTLCGTFKKRLWASQPPPGPPGDLAKALDRQSHIAQAICVLVSLLDLRLLPYYNIHKLLDAMFMCTRGRSCEVFVRTDNKGEPQRVDLHQYLRRVATSLVECLPSTNFSAIPEISQLLRSKDLLLPHFNLGSYRTLLRLVYHAYRNPGLAKKVMLPMVKDERTRRIAINREISRSLAARPTRLRMMGLDRVIYNFIWNQAGMELEPPPTFSTTSPKQWGPEIEKTRRDAATISSS